MANRSDLSARVSALLDGSQRRGRAGWWATASALSVAGLVVFTLAPVRAVTLPQKQTAASAQAPDSQSNTTEKRDGLGLDRALLRAAENGDIEGIEELLRAGANVNCSVSGGFAESPLIGAARKGHLDAVRLLLDRGADLNLEFGLVGNALIVAAGEGHVEIVSLLLDRGANIEHIVPGGLNALIRASEKGRLEVVKFLVARGADVNARAQVTTRIVKIVDGKPVTLFFKEVTVIKDGTRVNTTPRNGEWRTPLSMARKGGHQTVVDFLIASGARD